MEQFFEVRFSSEIAKKIHTINVNNQNNIEGLHKWRDYLRALKNYISNRKIAKPMTTHFCIDIHLFTFVSTGISLPK